MRKAICSLVAMVAMLAMVGSAVAKEPKDDAAKPDKPKAEKKEKESVEQRQQARKEAFEMAMSDQDYDKAISILDEMIADKGVAEEGKTIAMMTQFIILAEKKGDGAKACPLAKKLSEIKKDNDEVLNALAWTILDTANLKNRDLDLAMSIAQQAAQVSKHSNPAILDTLARAYFEKGDLDRAIEVQTKAVEKAKGDETVADELRTSLKETLEKYKAKKAGKKS